MNIMKSIQSYWGELMELIYPLNTDCVICKNVLKENKVEGICNDCYSQITFMDEDYWFQLQDMINTHSIRVLSVAAYRGAVRYLVFQFKYNQHTYLSKILGQMMAELVLEEKLEVDSVIAVPLHKKRQRERGFNQAELLARHIGKNLAISNIKGNLIRTKNTRVMHALTRRERKKNLLDAFKVKNPGVILNQNILLIDDILTTGTTIEACSRVLLEAGAKSVTAITFARGVFDDS